MNIEIIYKDGDILIVNKPAGVLVHPTLAKESNALTFWLTNKYPEIKDLNWPDTTRIGVVHRLDKDTSGLVILAKNPEILKKLQVEFQERKIKKTYLALVLGRAKEEGEIKAMITRGEAGKQKIQEFDLSFGPKVRQAVTYYDTQKYYHYKSQELSLIQAKPQTGRMHQIRVHLKYILHPIIGDPLYNTKESRKISKELNLNRQFLHAQKLKFIHPLTKEKISLESKLPEDLEEILGKLNE